MRKKESGDRQTPLGGWWCGRCSWKNVDCRGLHSFNRGYILAAGWYWNVLEVLDSGKACNYATCIPHTYITHVYSIPQPIKSNKAARNLQGVSTVANTANCYGTLCGSRDGGLSLSTGIWRVARDGDPCCDGMDLRLAMSSSSPSRDIFGSGLDPKTWLKLKGSQLVRCELMWVVEPRVQLCSAMFSYVQLLILLNCLPAVFCSRQCFGGWLDIPSGSVRGTKCPNDIGPFLWPWKWSLGEPFQWNCQWQSRIALIAMTLRDSAVTPIESYRYIWNIYRT